jgi:hypothetical protein
VYNLFHMQVDEAGYDGLEDVGDVLFAQSQVSCFFARAIGQQIHGILHRPEPAVLHHDLVRKTGKRNDQFEWRRWERTSKHSPRGSSF